jgi:hypothetical protein
MSAFSCEGRPITKDWFQCEETCLMTDELHEMKTYIEEY